jgi:hypothetical protein
MAQTNSTTEIAMNTICSMHTTSAWLVHNQIFQTPSYLSNPFCDEATPSAPFLRIDYLYHQDAGLANRRFSLEILPLSQ